MIKIPSVEQIRRCDAQTIDLTAISSWQLMEQAADTCAKHLESLFPDKQTRISVICGIGNNGGDGLAIARMMLQKDYTVHAILLQYSDKLSDDCSRNLKLMQQQYPENISIVRAKDEWPLFAADVVVDAILGTGISRAIDNALIIDAIKRINAGSSFVFSVDVPSGLYVDKPMDSSDLAVHADVTHSLAFPKLAYMFPENYDYVGEWNYYDIGLSQGCIDAVDTPYYAITPSAVQRMLPVRHKFDHKNCFGHGLLVAGSRGMCGAAIMAAKAAMRAGIGLLTVHVPKQCVDIVQIAVNEAICQEDEENTIFTNVDFKQLKYKAIAIGPGLGTHSRSAQGLKKMIADYGGPMVLDADAINILAENKTWLSFLPPHCIFTPHIKEFERLTGPCNNSYERLSKQQEFARKYNAIVILKGAHTCIAAPDGKCYFNTIGNAGMATAGSGDVLTGILLALLCQGLPALYAAIAGVFIHAAAADKAVEKQCMASLIASDIIENLKYV